MAIQGEQSEQEQQRDPEELGNLARRLRLASVIRSGSVKPVKQFSVHVTIFEVEDEKVRGNRFVLFLVNYL